MTRRSRFELVHSNAGWFVRFISSNGKEIARTSETYRHRVDALRAKTLIVRTNEDTRVWEVDERA